MLADRQINTQIDRQTDTLIAVLRNRDLGGVIIGNESVPIQLAQCWFPRLAIPLGLTRVLEYSRVLDSQNYWSNVLVLV